MIRLLCCAGLTLLTALVFGMPGSVDARERTDAREKTTATVVHVDEMCGGCVKKVHRRFDDDEKIGHVECDVKAKTVTFYPPEEGAMSARYLWVEMDEIGKTPLKLVCPQGTYRSKPRR